MNEFEMKHIFEGLMSQNLQLHPPCADSGSGVVAGNQRLMAHSLGTYHCADSSSDVIPTVLPREPSLPLHHPLPGAPGQERWDEAMEGIRRVHRKSLTDLLLTSDRLEEADRTAGGG